MGYLWQAFSKMPEIINLDLCQKLNHKSMLRSSLKQKQNAGKSFFSKFDYK